MKEPTTTQGNGQKRGDKTHGDSVAEPLIEVIRDALDQFSRSADDAEQRLKGATSELQTKVKSTAREAKGRSQEAATAVEGYVDSHPWSALGIAFGAGILLSSILRR
jgi:ElaB/YqjD/DUF883 family membrane-anchored ribosome-binding protein